MPNGPADTAFFDLSHTTDLSTSANTEVNGIVFDSNARLNPFTITARPAFTFTISGVGITNNSGAAQNFVTAVDASNRVGIILFANSATAGSGTSFINSGGETKLGSGGGVMLFHDSSTAGSATITNNAGSAQGAGAGVTYFDDFSSAGNGTFTNNPSTSNVGFDGGSTQFGATSTAANGTFTNNGAHSSRATRNGSVPCHFSSRSELPKATTVFRSVFARSW